MSFDRSDRPAVPSNHVVAVSLLLIIGSYLTCAFAATYPVGLTFGSQLPGQLTDPLEHLWLMRWSRSCLIEGRSPWFCDSLQAPIGVPLGYFPTLHVQTLGYLGLRMLTDNDVKCFNTLWFSGFVATGLGTFVLAWWVTRRSVASWLAGLGMMLCGPMLMHARGHLETMQMGAVPLFLIAWIRFVDRPNWSRLPAAVLSYWLVAASAPYFAILSLFPAGWYVVWSLIVGRAGTRRPWSRDRITWFSGYVFLTLPGLAILFSSQIWAALHGYSMVRYRREFDQFGAPIWSVFSPSPLHGLAKLTHFDIFQSTGYSGRMSECTSYLGVVGLASLAYAAGRRLSFPRASYWWSALGLMSVLSWGAHVHLGTIRLPAPAGWIYGIFPPFHLIRVPARFNLFAAVCASVPIAVALSDLLGRLGRPAGRLIFAAVCALAMMFDLSIVPFETSVIPPMPSAYRDIARSERRVTIAEVPMFASDEGQVFSSLWGYWQSIHGARTTAGYPGIANTRFDDEVVHSSPFWVRKLRELVRTNPLEIPGIEVIPATTGRDQAWLYLRAHHLDWVVVHQGRWTDPRDSVGVEWVKELLATAKVYEDADVAVFDVARIPTPTKLQWLCIDNRNTGLKTSNPKSFGISDSLRIAVFNPDSSVPLRLIVSGAASVDGRRSIRLDHQGRPLDRWTVEPGPGRDLETNSFLLGPGLQRLDLIVEDGDLSDLTRSRRNRRNPSRVGFDAVSLRPVGTLARVISSIEAER